MSALPSWEKILMYNLVNREMACSYTRQAKSWLRLHVNYRKLLLEKYWKHANLNTTRKYNLILFSLGRQEKHNRKLNIHLGQKELFYKWLKSEQISSLPVNWHSIRSKIWLSVWWTRKRENTANVFNNSIYCWIDSRDKKIGDMSKTSSIWTRKKNLTTEGMKVIKL